MKIRVKGGELKDEEFTVDSDHIDEEKGVMVCGATFCTYVPVDCYEILEE